MPAGTTDDIAGPSSSSAAIEITKPAVRVSNLVHNSTSNIVNSPSSTKVPKSAQHQPFGGFSFESESLPDFSEFEGNTSGSETQDPVAPTQPDSVVKKRKPGDERLF